MLLRVAVVTAGEAAEETTGWAVKTTHLEGNLKERLEYALFVFSFCIFLNCQHKNPALLESYSLQAATEAIVNKPFPSCPKPPFYSKAKCELTPLNRPFSIY